MLNVVVLQKNRSSGFGLLELLVALAMISFILAGVVGLNVHLSRAAGTEAFETAIAVFRRNIIVSVIDANAWAFTYNANASGGGYPGGMDCLKYNVQMPCLSGATPITNQPFAVFNGSGGLLYNGTSPTEGFNRDGVRCWTFDPSNATNGCFFRFDLVWSASCDTANCVNPMVVVSGQIRIAANAPFQVNTSLYAIPPTYRTAH